MLSPSDIPESPGLSPAELAEFKSDVETRDRLPGMPDPYRPRPWLEKLRAEWLKKNPQ